MEQKNVISQNILLVETSASKCSVTLCNNERIIETIESEQSNSHASKLSGMILSICSNNQKSIKDFSGICFSAGPGSYTGLRIGLSTIKGISYVSEVPIFFVNTLDALASAMIEEQKNEEAIYCPMIDARRKEVYFALYDNNGVRLSEYETNNFDHQSEFNILYEKKYIILGGDGTKHSVNCFYNKEVIHSKIIHFSSEYLIKNAIKKIENKEFEVNSFCEPLYLKKPIFNIKKQ